MSIWKNSKLLPHSYEKTLISIMNRGGEQLIIWLEGTKTKLSFPLNFRPFGICGGSINTNAGVSFTKEELLEIANSMKEGAMLKIAACNSLYITKKDLEYSHSQKTTVEDDFKKDNLMIQIGDNSFTPLEFAKKFIQETPEKIQKGYLSSVKRKIKELEDES